MNKERVEELIRELLVEIGEDPDRDGLLKTPRRVAESLAFLTTGYEQSVDAVINNAVFPSQANNMIIARNIEVYSLCEHHMLPFYGKIHVAYIPNGKILGLSKTARIVDVYARRLQVQERLTDQIADAIMEILSPRGVGVVLEARHLCMMMRGVEKQHSVAVTSALRGSFRDDAKTRDEFLRLAHAGVLLD